MTAPAIRKAVKLWILLSFSPTALSISNLSDSRGSPSNSAQPRMLTGKRTLCPDGSGSQKFGYIEVSPITEYFYAAIEADKDPATAPTFIFLRGGPGGSSVASAIQMNGPCISDVVTKRLRLNLYSWTTQANGVWFDAPAPTGFSVGPVTTGLEDFILDMIDVITKFTQQNPTFNRNVHLVGLSASAAFVAMLGARLAAKPQPQVHIVGVMLMSGVVSPIDMIAKMTADLGLCDTQIGQCNSNGPGKSPISAFCKQAVTACEDATVRPLEARKISYYDVRVPSGQEYTKYVLKSSPVDTFLNNPQIQQELGVSKKWATSNDEVYKAYDIYTAYETTPFVVSLLDKGLKFGGVELGKMRALVYSNQARLAFIKVTEAGHSIVAYKPREVQQGFLAYLSGDLWKSGWARSSYLGEVCDRDSEMP
ncbi:hypothetical protein FOZ60_014455 [Perkinsus olseni]|uniref:Uncharacterized protein n=1 Tax=Perkinsus olseni TaxID=32597 RepID=A0A7J6N7F7_PEROL|nr:hypothetical protein FOZ60_014455 [Perkinsus olseni]